MKILSPSQIKQADAYTIANEPVSSVDLMERAASACVDWIVQHISINKRIYIFSGPGNNGGDGLAIARMLLEKSYGIEVYLLTDFGQLSPDAKVNYSRLRDSCVLPYQLSPLDLPDIPHNAIVIDALFGIGLSRPLDGLVAQIVAHINRSGARVISIDVPSGLFCEGNEQNNPEAVIRAHETLTFQQPKLSFFFADNADFVGKWIVLDIGLLPEGINQAGSSTNMLCEKDISIPWRKKFAHKGDFGHSCIMAGSYGMMGAAVLTVRACLRSGAGLTTAHIPCKGIDIMQISAPEAIVSFDSHPEHLSQIPDLSKYTAIAVGPGIRKSSDTQQMLYFLLIEAKKNHIPLVLDADALNILSEHKDWLDLLPSETIITPHPKEFDRLAGHSPNSYQRYLKQKEMSKAFGIIIVLKGAYTCIALPDGRSFFNTTGNPGMATGGSGDVLTGIIVSLLAQGWSPCKAACAGVWIHGTAGDKAVRKEGEQALIAGDIIRYIGKVFKELQKNNRP